jgi:hypothetical protein
MVLSSSAEYPGDPRHLKVLVRDIDIFSLWLFMMLCLISGGLHRNNRNNSHGTHFTYKYFIHCVLVLVERLITSPVYHYLVTNYK